MFDPDDGSYPIHCDPVSDTKELTKLFYSMTEEIWKDLNFGDANIFKCIYAKVPLT